jgi:hypothetical protein
LTFKQVGSIAKTGLDQPTLVEAQCVSPLTGL